MNLPREAINQADVSCNCVYFYLNRLPHVPQDKNDSNRTHIVACISFNR